MLIPCFWHSDAPGDCLVKNSDMLQARDDGRLEWVEDMFHEKLEAIS